MDPMQINAPETTDDIPEVSFEELYESDEGSHLERVARELSRLNESIAKRGVCRSDAAAIQMTAPAALDPRYPLNSYTEVPSKTNLTVTMDSVFSSIKATAQRFWEWLCETLEKLWDWITGTKANTDPKDVKEEAKMADAKMDEARKAANAEPDKKKAESVMAGDKPAEVAQAKENEEASYSNLVRLCYQDPTWITTLLGYVRNKGSFLQATIMLYNRIQDYYGKLKQITTTEQLDSAVGEFKQALVEYETAAEELMGYAFKLKHPSIQFTVADSAIESMTNLFKAIQTAGSTRSKSAIETDFPGGLKPVTSARLAICDFAAVEKEQNAKHSSAYNAIRGLQRSMKKCKPADLYLSKFARENRPAMDTAIEYQKKALAMIKDAQNVIELLPETIIANMRKHIRATIKFANAVKVELGS